MKPLVFFDLETGGLDPDRHAIIQIAAISLDVASGEELEVFERKLTFKASAADSEALAHNSYDPEVWAREAVPPPQALREFADLMRRHASVELTSKAGKPYSVARLAGHNAASFDMPFLRRYFKLCDLFMPGYFLALDTAQLAGWWNWANGSKIANVKLETLAEYFGLHLDAHDALNDVRATALVARYILEDMGYV